MNTIDISDTDDQPNDPTTDEGLVPAIRDSLEAKLERLLSRPLIARIVATADEACGSPNPDDDLFGAIDEATRDYAHDRGAWSEDPETSVCTIRVAIDYDDLWRESEKEVLDLVKGTIESAVAFLTDQQRALLERSPREFLALDPGPEAIELVGFETENVGGSTRVVELRVAQTPETKKHVRHVVVVPNLIPLERQLAALAELRVATDEGALAPLRALVGLAAAPVPNAPQSGEVRLDPVGLLPDERLDEFQSACVEKAMTTPHFAVIQGPPGSGKTTVITGIVRRALMQGERVLVVSPTHVAVDNVVEKLTQHARREEADTLDTHTLPVRYSARLGKLSTRAKDYWVGGKRQHRAATLSRRIEKRLTANVPFAAALYANEDKDAHGTAPLSGAIAAVQPVICGTPIGILSCDAVKAAPAAAFDLLIVDEVSKMTLPEFLAVAVKARRWVLVGDPEQLPPYNDCAENGCTLDGVLAPELELVCSVGALAEGVPPAERRAMHVVVVAQAPERVAASIRAHLEAVFRMDTPSVATVSEGTGSGIVVCAPEDVDAACDAVLPMAKRDRAHNPRRAGTVQVLYERGLRVKRPEFASGVRLVETSKRAQATLFEKTYTTYHTQPWSKRSGQDLQRVEERRGIDKCLPSERALTALGLGGADAAAERRDLVARVAERFAINAVSVYDWLTGMPTQHFDVSPLVELGFFVNAELCDAVRPFVGTLRKQYRMHPSLSRVPREWFYFGEALHDGEVEPPHGPPPCRVTLRQVDAPPVATDDGESNLAEVEAIGQFLVRLDGLTKIHDPGKSAEVMVITPYRRQEARLTDAVDALRACGKLSRVAVEVCTLDRCQGREAEYVFISLVRNRATRFTDVPKRWNVALTRAMQGLFIVGDVNSYLENARGRDRDRNGQVRGPSLVARLIHAYEKQIAQQPRSHG